MHDHVVDRPRGVEDAGGHRLLEADRPLLGCVIEVAEQQHLRPYREPESNTLKALVDTQLFLAFLVSFILRVLDVPGFLGSEPFGAEMYGLLLLCSMVLLATAAIALPAKWRSSSKHSR